MGFQKIYLEPGEKRAVEIPINRYSTAVWDEKRNSWCCEKGTYTASVVGGETTLESSFELEKSVFWNGL